MRSRFAAPVACLALSASLIFAADPPKPAKPAAKAPAKAAPSKGQLATPAPSLKVPKGFEVELLYSVPKEQEGSWVNLCVDPKGRLVASDQYGALYRVTPSKLGEAPGAKVEKLPAAPGMAQGLLYAFDALYVVVNGGDKSGLYRVTDTDNDDQPDKVEKLRGFEDVRGGGLGEHGPHAVLKHPDGKRLTVVCGNQTRLPKVDTSLVPQVWGEDHLIPRVPDGNNFMRGVLAPGGYVCNVDPDGKNWELVSMGFRNQYDAAYNAAGDLFTYDADMEWDMNTPWYRPTRVCHVVPGTDFGWRNGAGKYREHYLDNAGPVVNIGPGSPTGVCFGTGAKFPAKYQDALFISDWSYGKLYAVHLKPEGASYTAAVEEFIAGSPLPLTDVVVSPVDGAMYFAIGGRKTQSGLYRVRYTGPEPTAPSNVKIELPPAAMTRRMLETPNPKAGMDVVGSAWPHLASPDRVLRSSARTALERVTPSAWYPKAFAETDPAAALPALLAVARTAAPCPLHAVPGATPPDAGIRPNLLAAINRIDFAKLPENLKLDYCRVLTVALHRLGVPEGAERAALLKTLEPAFPGGGRVLDAHLLELLVGLDSPVAVTKGLAALAAAPTQEEQIDLAASLRRQKSGWTPTTRAAYFGWYNLAAGYRGGNSFQGFLKHLKTDALTLLTPDEVAALKPILDARPAPRAATLTQRPFVKKWSIDELGPKVGEAMAAGGRDFESGRKLFAAANCFACHRYDSEGGNSGPDLSGVAGRFSTRDLLESILDPSKEVSDQYAAVEILTLDGQIINGRIANHNGENVMVHVDMLDPNAIKTVSRKTIDEFRQSKLSLMPAGLLDSLTEQEVYDLMAYLLSRGDRNAAVFKKK